MRYFLIPSFLLLATVRGAGAQQGSGTGNVSVSAKIGAKSYDASGPGSCRHEPGASIYNVPASLWMVEHASSGDGAIKHINLTLWQPKDGSPQQLSLNLRTRSSTHRIDAGGRGEQVGTGKASLSARAKGGIFEIKGRDESGTPIEVLIECAAFAGIEAEGG